MRKVISERRMGELHIIIDVYKENPEEVQKLFTSLDFLIFNCNYDYANESLVYRGYSPKFKPSFLGSQIPVYRVTRVFIGQSFDKYHWGEVKLVVEL